MIRRICASCDATQRWNLKCWHDGILCVHVTPAGVQSSLAIYGFRIFLSLFRRCSLPFHRALARQVCLRVLRQLFFTHELSWHVLSCMRVLIFSKKSLKHISNYFAVAQCVSKRQVGISQLRTARSRLYRSRFLQLNTCSKSVNLNVSLQISHIQ